MKKLCFTFLILILITSPRLMGQYGNKQAGLRTGYRGGIFYQITSDAGNAEVGYNAMLGFSSNGIQLTGLRIIYETSLSEISPDLFLTWGYGGHAGFIFTDHLGFLGERYNFQGERFCPVLGADGWLAAEYRFRDIPLNISLNLKPFAELTIPAFVKIMPLDLGVSVSYVF
ncbi:MAG: hypothetical protein EPN88_01220 [Bacteroidetes bacterium]|nr:MAG: hypothetical protein EPN88_01220 [Bacteroidota bacterium]